jgi:structural maintenance of chromosomes protein 6
VSFIYIFHKLFVLTPERSTAQVKVTIKNQGEDAYKPKIYGDSIIIQRQFTKSGSSSYKIMSKAEKTISTKREELSNICDHMNIQVDNPMNILTQDSARYDYPL